MTITIYTFIHTLIIPSGTIWKSVFDTDAETDNCSTSKAKATLPPNTGILKYIYSVYTAYTYLTLNQRMPAVFGMETFQKYVCVGFQ